MINNDPFDDPDLRKQILQEEGIDGNLPDLGGDDYEVVSDLQSMISSAPKIPGRAKNTILDANSISKNQRTEMSERMNYALTEVLSKYNKTYGTDLSINISNLSETLIDVSDPKKREVLELYVSETMKSIKPILLLQILGKLTVAIEYVLDPQRMFDPNSFSAADMFLVIDKLMSYCAQLDELVKEASIKDSDKILKRIAEEQGDSDISSETSKQAVENFMSLFRKDSGIDE